MIELVLWVKLLLIGLMFFLVMLSAFFSGTETAYSSVSRSKIEDNIKKGKKSSILILKHYKKFGWTLSTILIFNNLVNIASSTVLAFLLSSFNIDNVMATIITICVLTPIIVIFGEILPKIFAKKNAFSYLTKVVFIINILNYMFYPITYPLSKLAMDSSSITNTELELKTIIELAENEGVLEKDEADLVHNALDFDSKKILSIMVKRKKIDFIDIKWNKEKILNKFQSSGHSRLPIKRGHKFIGVLILKDFIFNKDKSIENLIKKPVSFSKSKLISSSLEEMRKERIHMAFIINNKTENKVIGLATIEDIVEELIGDIYDEHDQVGDIFDISLNSFRSNGNGSINKLFKHIGIPFKKVSDKTTVKKWVSENMNRSIKKGITYKWNKKVSFKVSENQNGKPTIFIVKILNKKK